MSLLRLWSGKRLEKSELFVVNTSNNIYNISSIKLIDYYSLYSISGKLITSSELNKAELEIDLNNYGRGVYFIVLETKNTVWSYKLIRN